MAPLSQSAALDPESFGLLDKRIVAFLEKRGIKTPTNPQKEAIKCVLNKNNLLLISPTGTGKTEAVLLPIFNLILENHDKRIYCVYITPLKALNRDLVERMEAWGSELGIDIEVRHGDTSNYVRSQQASDPPHVLITTPETLQAILVGKRMKEHLKSVEFIVIDEIHEIYKEKRGIQLAVAIERLKAIIGRDFRRIGLSATVGNKEGIASLLQGSSKDKIKVIDIKMNKPFSLGIDWPEIKDEDIEMGKKINSSPQACSVIRKITEGYSKKKGVLIFVNTREGAELLSSRFRELNEKIGVHHSSLSKESRLNTEKSFKNGDMDGLVCTSSLQLGIDIGRIETVMQFMSPRRIEILLQRIGRSKHTTDGVSEGQILVIDEDDAIESIAVSKLAKLGVLEPINGRKKPYDVLAHQIVGLIMDGQKDPKKEFDIVKSSSPFENLEYSEFLEVLNLLASLHLIRKYTDGVGLTKGSFEYYFSNLSMIPDTKGFDVINIENKGKIAQIHEEFAAELEQGDAFIVGGKCWRVLSKEDKIMVEPSKMANNAPEWVGEQMPVDFTVSQTVAEIKNQIWNLDEDKGAVWLRNYCLESGCSIGEKVVNSVVNDTKRLHTEPSKDKIVIERFGKDYVVLHSYFGSLANETIGRVLSSYLTLKYGTSVGLRCDQYRIALKFPVKAEPVVVKEALEKLDPAFIESTLRTVLKHGALFKQRFLHVARRFGVVSRGAKFSKLGIKRLIETFEMSPVFEETLQELFSEKLDLENTKKIAGLIKDGKIKLEIVEKESEFAKRFLEQYDPEIVVSDRPKAEILQMIKEKLENRRVELACLYCKKWRSSLLVKNSGISCPICNSRLITSGYEEDLKLITKRELDAQEKHKLLKLRKLADLYLSYGKNALLCIAARGIGPDTAARILSKSRSEEELLQNILEAEKQYTKTRMFWDKKP